MVGECEYADVLPLVTAARAVQHRVRRIPVATIVPPTGLSTTKALCARVLADIVALACGFVNFSYLSRTLGSATYGDYAVAFLFALWCTELLSAVAGPSTLRMVAGHAEGAAFANTMLQFVTVVGAALGIAVVAFVPAITGWFDSPPARQGLWILAASIPLTSMSGVHLMVALGQGRMLAGPSVLVGYWLVRLLLSILFVHAGFGIAGAAAAVFLAEVTRYAVIRRLSDAQLLGSVRMPLTAAVRHGQLVIGSGLLMRVLGSMDLLAVRWLAPAAASAGIYAAAQNIANVPWMVLGGSAGILLRSIAAARFQQGREQITVTASVVLRLVVTGAGLTLAVVPMSADIVSLVLGEEYAAAGSITAILLVAAACRILSAGGRAIADGLERRWSSLLFLIALTTLGMGAFVLTGPVLAHRFGYLGHEPMQGYAVLATMLAALSATWNLMAGTANAGCRFPWTTLARTSAAAAGAAVVGCWFPGPGLAVLPRLALSATAYLGAMWMLGERPTVGQASRPST